MIKKNLKRFRRQLYDNWLNLYDSTKKKMSRGAQNLSKIITFPRKDNWRRPPK